jgi:hypothetical protein
MAAASSVFPQHVQRLANQGRELASAFPQADELKRTGRWRRYFATEDAFEEALRKASIDGAKWKRLAYRNDG